MPTYTYRCNKCGEEIEVFQSMSDPPLKRCKQCRGVLRRTFHPVGIVLKGSGFYKTDYRSDRKRRSGSSDDSKRESKSDSKDDSKKTTSKSEGTSASSETSGAKKSS